MSTVRIMALCLCAALICASLRSAHPQIASAVALAAGVAALMLSTGDLAEIASAARQLDTALDGHGRKTLKLCAVALLAEFAADICRDAGEAALSKRIEVGVKIGVTAAALPLASQVLESISALISHLS